MKLPRALCALVLILAGAAGSAQSIEGPAGEGGGPDWLVVGIEIGAITIGAELIMFR